LHSPAFSHCYPEALGGLGKLPCYEAKVFQQRRPSDGGGHSLRWASIKWHAPPKQVLMQTVLHLDAVSSFWELSCLIKGMGKIKTGDGELLWEQRHPWQGWSQHRHKRSQALLSLQKLEINTTLGRQFACLPDHIHVLGCHK